MELKENEQQFLDACAEARKIAFSFSNPLIVHHYDADGISAGAIVEAAFRKGIQGAQEGMRKETLTDTANRKAEGGDRK